MGTTGPWASLLDRAARPTLAHAALGWVVALGVLLLRNPRLLADAALTPEDLTLFARQYGDVGALAPRFYGYVQLPFLQGWLIARAVPVIWTPRAMIAASLAACALPAAALLSPLVESWLVTPARRLLAFGLVTALPISSLSLVSSLAFSHLSWFLLAVLLVVSLADPLGWSARASRAELTLVLAVLALASWSTPASALLVPVAVAGVLRRGAGVRQRWLLGVVLAQTLIYVALGLRPGEAPEDAGVGGPVSTVSTLVVRTLALFGDRVVFESVFGYAAKLWLVRAVDLGAAIVYALGGGLWLGSLAAQWRALTRDREGAFASAALTVVAGLNVALAVATRGRLWGQDAAAWQLGQFRYFFPAAFLWLVALVPLAGAWLERRSLRWLGSLGAWALLSSVVNARRFEEQCAVLVLASPEVAWLGALPQGGRAAAAAEQTDALTHIEELERTLEADHSELVPLPGSASSVTVFGRR